MLALICALQSIHSCDSNETELEEHTSEGWKAESGTTEARTTEVVIPGVTELAAMDVEVDLRDAELPVTDINETEKPALRRYDSLRTKNESASVDVK
jgi:hypothetical protein